MNYSPIVLFTYNRPWHTKKTIESLQKNELASESILYIYSDAPKNEQAVEEVKKVREYIRTVKGFKDIKIIEREKNYGLAKSIIDGVTTTIKKYGRIIVLEDDLITSPYFLNFMNEALEFYKDKKKVWHISGWNYPINDNGLGDVFLWRVMNCWGWATWNDRWSFYEKNVDKIINEFSSKDIKRFNLDGAEKFWDQIIANKKKKINTWAIFWYAIIFKNNGLCLNPTKTLVQNIGLDGSGVNCQKTDIFKSELSMKKEFDFNIDLSENRVAVERIKEFYFSQKRTFFIRAINKFSRIIIGRNLIK